MTAFLDVETADFLTASQMINHDVGDHIGDAVLKLQFALGDCAAMSGNDPAGTEWAAAYDKGAAAAIAAAEDVVNATYRVGALFAQTARNYAAADAASGGHPDEVPSGPAPVHNGAPCVRPPSSGGGTGGEPHGWFLIRDTVGRAWPNGHQDRLRRAANIWRGAAGAFESHAGCDHIARIGDAFLRDRLPEADDMSTVCSALGGHIAQAAYVFRELAASCDQLATHIDQVHSEVEHELTSLLAQSAAVQGVGALVSAVSFGTAEAPTQVVEAGRIYAVARKVRDVIDTFAALTRAVTAEISGAAERAVAVASKARVLVGARLSVAQVELAARYPRLATAIRDRLAIYRLEGDAGQVVLRKMTVSIAQAERKFKHAADLGVAAARGREGFRQFAVVLQRFVRAPTTTRIMGYNRGAPAILSYDRKSMMIVIQHADGRFWTCFRLTRWQLSKLEQGGRIGLE